MKKLVQPEVEGSRVALGPPWSRFQVCKFVVLGGRPVDEFRGVVSGLELMLHLVGLNSGIGFFFSRYGRRFLSSIQVSDGN